MPKMVIWGFPVYHYDHVKEQHVLCEDIHSTFVSGGKIFFCCLVHRRLRVMSWSSILCNE